MNLALWVLLLAPGAQELSLSWSAPEGCPSKKVVLENIVAALGRPLHKVETPLLVMSATVTASPGPRFEVKLRLKSESGTRHRALSARTCLAVAQASALMATLTLDAVLESTEVPELDPGVPTATTTEKKAPAPPEKRGPLVPRSQTQLALKRMVATPDLSLSLGARLHLGVIPGAAPGLSLGFGAAFQRVLLELGLFYLFERSRLNDAGVGGRFSTYALSLKACYRAPLGFLPAWRFALRVGACLSGEVGWSRVAGVGAPENAALNALLLSGSVQGILELRLYSPLWLRLGAALGVPLFRDRFVLANIGEVYQAPGIIGYFFFGVSVDFR